LLAILAWRKLIRSARDISDGGIAVALAQAAFTRGIGATVEQDPSLLAHPLFGLFAEPASTIIVTTDPKNLSEIDAIAGQHNFFSAHIGTTGGNRLEISVDGESFISAPLAELRTLWASALEANLRNEVPA
jgi:phosphoribosylformylglycinamidine synthase